MLHNLQVKCMGEQSQNDINLGKGPTVNTALTSWVAFLAGWFKVFSV